MPLPLSRRWFSYVENVCLPIAYTEVIHDRARMAKRTEEDCTAELNANLRLLSKSCAEFDRGDLDEFRNMARALRLIIVPDAQNDNKSLIELAGREQDGLIDSGVYAHRLSIAPEFALVGIVAGHKTFGCRAPLSFTPRTRRVPLSEWLSSYPVIRDPTERAYTRLELVKFVANLGGATHFPENVRAHFKKLQDIAIEGTRYGFQTKYRYGDFEKHTLRQIAFEVSLSFTGESAGIAAEDGTMVMMGQEFLLYPGRRTYVSVVMNQVGSKPGKIRPLATSSLSGLRITLPYPDTEPSAECPCDSGLPFKDCCATPHEFDSDFMKDFERNHGLGLFRPNEAVRRPGE